MPAYKWFLPGRADPLSRADQIWPDPSTGGGWVKMGGTLGRFSKTEQTFASTLRDLPNGLWNELWEVELEAPRTNDRGIVIAKRGRLVRRVEAWNEETANRLYGELREMRMRWAREILSLEPPGMAPSDPIPMFLMSSIISSHAFGGSLYTSQQLNEIIQKNSADALQLAVGHILPGDDEKENVFISVQLMQNGSLFAAGVYEFARVLVQELRFVVPPDFDWYPSMKVGWDQELERQAAWLKRELEL